MIAQEVQTSRERASLLRCVYIVFLVLRLSVFRNIILVVAR
jgi:hypothetical protein